MDDPFKPLTPTVAPGLKFERVPGTQVIKVLNQVAYALQIAYLNEKGGFPTVAISVVMSKIGAWMAMTNATNRMREFKLPTDNETWIKAYETMGTEIAEDLGILEEYEKVFGNLDTEVK